MAQVGIVGAGSWGTAVASQLGNARQRVCLWTREKSDADSINASRENKKHLPGYKLSPAIKATSDMEELAADKDLIILATPSLYLVHTVKLLLKTTAFQVSRSAENTENTVPIIGILSKGFLPSEAGHPLFITQTLEQILPAPFNTKLVYISGPSHAEEVVQGKLTGLIVASSNPIASIRTREILRSRSLLVFSSLDVIGVQTCAAAKNIIAIAFGMLAGFKESSNLFGDNTESLLLAAGLNEMQTLGRALGATHVETFTSIAGVGDLDVTCRSKYGRNRRFGMQIVTDHILDAFTDIDDILNHPEKVGYIAEGVPACKYVYRLSEEKNIKLPISDVVYKVLNKEVAPQDIFLKLLAGEKI